MGASCAALWAGVYDVVLGTATLARSRGFKEGEPGKTGTDGRQLWGLRM